MRRAHIPEPVRSDEQMNRRRRRKRGKRRWITAVLLLCAIVAIIYLRFRPLDSFLDNVGGRMSDVDASKPEINVDLLDVNPYSRPGTEIDKIRGIVIHYVANPGSTAKQNRDYFNQLQYRGETSASSHFIVGLDGEIVQCVPTWEIAYASNDRNDDTVSIECCHPDESGKFNRKTYRSVVNLTAWLCVKFNLEAGDVIRHYDVTGKNCPKYFVEHEKAWKQFRADVAGAIRAGGYSE